MTEIIVLVGLPGSSKSTLARSMLPEVEIVDGDSLRTGEHVAAKVRTLKDCGKPIIVDATNAAVKRRSLLIAIAKEWKVPVHCVWLTLDAKTCIQRAKERYEKGGPNITPVVIYSIRKHFEEPTMEEGFDSILKV